MSDREKADAGAAATSSAVSLTLIYTLIVNALIAAIGIAAFIVLPFYHRH